MVKSSIQQQFIKPTFPCSCFCYGIISLPLLLPNVHLLLCRLECLGQQGTDSVLYTDFTISTFARGYQLQEQGCLSTKTNKTEFSQHVLLISHQQLSKVDLKHKMLLFAFFLKLFLSYKRCFGNNYKDYLIPKPYSSETSM